MSRPRIDSPPTSVHNPPQELLEPYHYISKIQGKGVRSKIMACFNKWLNIDNSYLKKLDEIIGMLHNASLMIDDIEDDSTLRRGIPVCHSIYGVPNTINTANYVYFLAMEKVHNLGGPEANRVFLANNFRLEELLNLHRGQGYDIYWRDNNTCPTEDQYREMVSDKTGGLFRLALRLMQVFSDDKRNFIKLVDLLGLYYQIRDDYINLQSADYQKNKSFAEDLSEGKFSFPIIHSILSKPSDRRLLNILKRRNPDIEVKKHAINYMKETKSFEYTLNILKGINEEIRKEIEVLGGNEDLVKLLDYLESIGY